jgi:hypothetical protein
MWESEFEGIRIAQFGIAVSLLTNSNPQLAVRLSQWPQWLVAKSLSYLQRAFKSTLQPTTLSSTKPPLSPRPFTNNAPPSDLVSSVSVVSLLIFLFLPLLQMPDGLQTLSLSFGIFFPPVHPSVTFLINSLKTRALIKSIILPSIQSSMKQTLIASKSVLSLSLQCRSGRRRSRRQFQVASLSP